MADRIEQKYMSYDDWKELGPLFQPAEPEGDNIYDGTTRERPTTPKWASASLGGPNKLLGNPDHSGRRDSFTNAHSQWMHIMKTLDAGGDPAMKLVREAAKTGNKMHELSERMHGNGNAWVALAGDAQTAKVLRGFITTTLEQFPPAKGVLPQELPTSPEDARLKEISTAMAAHQPKRFRKRVLEDGHIRFADGSSQERAADKSFEKTNKTQARGNAKPRQYAGMMALFADDGMEDQAAAYAAKSDTRLAIAPEKNAALWKAMSAERPQGVYYPRAYNPNSKQWAAGDELAQRADGGVFFWNGDHNSRAFAAAAEFSRQGKALRIHGPDGKELPLFETAREAEQAHQSKKEFAQSQSHHAFDLSAKEPMAHYGLSLIKHDKLGTLNDKDINRLSQMDETVNDIADMADTAQGREYLLKEQKISGGAVKLLGDKDAMTNARQSLLEIRREMQADNVDIIGPRDYPESLVRSGSVPPYLFIQGDKDFFRNADTIIGVTGSPARDDRARRLTTSPAAEAMSSLTMQPATVAYVQGQTPVDMPESGPQIMVATAGQAHTSDADRAKESRIIENGGAVIRTLPSRHSSFYYDAKAWNEERGKKGKLIGVPATGSQHTENASAGLMSAMSSSVVITDLDRGESHSHQHVALRQSLASGRKPAVLNFQDYEGISHVSGNRALLANRGTRALQQAGLGNRDVEEFGPALEGQKPALDTGRNMGLAMENLVRHTKGQDIKFPEASRAKPREAEAEL